MKFAENSIRRFAMGDFGAAERRILEFMSKGTEFVFNGKGYTVMLSGNQHVIKVNRNGYLYIGRIL